MSTNITRKELKQPDPFVGFMTRFSAEAQEALSARRRPLLIGLGALAVVGVVLIALAQVNERSARRDSRALARVDRIATAELLPADGAAKPDVADDGLPHFKTEKERLEAALKELDTFLNARPRSRLRAEALIHRGAYLLDLQRADEAIAVYTQLLDNGDVEGQLRPLALEGLGYAHEAKGDLDKAAATFARLGEGKDGKAAAPTAFYGDRALYHKARIADLKGNHAEAAKLYREVLDKVPATSLRDDIANRLAVLEPK